jgi:hypothetical protein
VVHDLSLLAVRLTLACVRIGAGILLRELCVLIGEH